MSTRTTLTKSLHTVTAVSRIAVLPVCNAATAEESTRRALTLLGQPSDWPETDPTFAACVAKVRALRGGK